MKYKLSVYIRAFDPDWNMTVAREAKTFFGDDEKSIRRRLEAWIRKQGINREEIETRFDFNI